MKDASTLEILLGHSNHRQNWRSELIENFVTYENTNKTQKKLLKIVNSQNMDLPQPILQNENNSLESKGINIQNIEQNESFGDIDVKKEDQEKFDIRKHIEAILFSATKKHSKRNVKLEEYLTSDNKLSSFAKLNFDPVGIEVLKNKHNSHSKLLEKRTYHKHIDSGSEITLKGKMVGFVPAKAINQALEFLVRKWEIMNLN